jgi:hypothetical protein
VQFITLFVIFLASSICVFKAFYGEWPLLSSYAVYLLNPPGPLPINPYGSIWFAIICIILWVIFAKSQNAKTQNPHMAKVIWIVSLLCFANFTYYLGRSHDNNILNLIPYFVLLLIGLSRWSAEGRLKIITSVMLASIIGWTTQFGFSNYLATISANQFLDKSPKLLIKSFNRNSDSNFLYSLPLSGPEIQELKELQIALEYIQFNFNESVEIYDKYLVIDSKQTPAPWNALHGPENFPFVPSELREKYLKNISKRFQKPGWIVFAKEFSMKNFLKDYDASYQRDLEVDFGSYYAIRYTPK